MVELSGLIFPTFFIYVGNVPHPDGNGLQSTWKAQQLN